MLYIAKLDVFPVKIIKFSLMGMMLIAILEKKNAYEREKKKLKNKYLFLILKSVNLQINNIN